MRDRSNLGSTLGKPGRGGLEYWGFDLFVPVVGESRDGISNAGFAPVST